MKRLTTLSLIAIAAAAMIAVPLDAQTRGGSNSRGGSGGGNSRGGGGSRPSSSMSAPSSQMRGSGSAGNTKGLGSAAPRSSQPSMSSQNRGSQPSRPSGGSSPAVRGGSNTRSSSPSGSVTRQAPSSGNSRQTPPSGSSGSVNRQNPPASTPGNTSSGNRSTTVREPSRPEGGSVNRNSGTQARPNGGQPIRGGSNTSGSVTSGADRQRQARPEGGRPAGDRPGGSVNRNQPQPGMSADRNAPATVRNRDRAPRNYSGSREPREIRMRPGPGRNIERVHPRHRDPMPYNHAVRFWDGGHHYFGYRVSYLPSRFIREVFWGVPYYILDGIYYRYYGGYYYISRPPFGVYFDPVLDDLYYSSLRFSYYYDVNNTYRIMDENAQTIASQNATIAANNATIASQNAEIALNTERAAKAYQEANRLGLVQSYADAAVEYFYQDGVFFTKDANGKYITIVPPAGALVEELPDDYETITLDGKEYYKVDDTVFQMTIIDGSPYFEVLGQLTGELAEKFNSYNKL